MLLLSKKIISVLNCLSKKTICVIKFKQDKKTKTKKHVIHNLLGEKTKT